MHGTPVVAGVLRMSTALSIETRLVDGEILAVLPHGTLDATTTDQFNQAIQNHLDQGRTKIIIDCRKLDYVSSLGIGSLVALQARVRKKGGEVKLAALFGLAAEAIRLVGLNKVLNIYGDLEFARKSFYPSRSHADESAKSASEVDPLVESESAPA
jgi:anti-anti-sigma factor